MDQIPLLNRHHRQNQMLYNSLVYGAFGIIAFFIILIWVNYSKLNEDEKFQKYNKTVLLSIVLLLIAIFIVYYMKRYR